MLSRLERSVIPIVDEHMALDFLWLNHQLCREIRRVGRDLGLSTLTTYQTTHSGASIDRLKNARSLSKVQMRSLWQKCESGCAYHGITDIVTNLLMKVQHVAVSENSVHNSCVPFTVIWTWNFVLSLSRQTGRNLQHSLKLHVPGFYSKRTVNIGDVSITDYLVAEVWCDRMTAVMRW